MPRRTIARSRLIADAELLDVKRQERQQQRHRNDGGEGTETQTHRLRRQWAVPCSSIASLSIRRSIRRGGFAGNAPSGTTGDRRWSA